MLGRAQAALQRVADSEYNVFQDIALVDGCSSLRSPADGARTKADEASVRQGLRPAEEDVEADMGAAPAGRELHQFSDLSHMSELYAASHNIELLLFDLFQFRRTYDHHNVFCACAIAFFSIGVILGSIHKQWGPPGAHGARFAGHSFLKLVLTGFLMVSRSFAMKQIKRSGR